MEGTAGRGACRALPFRGFRVASCPAAGGSAGLAGDASAALAGQDEAQQSGPDQALALPASILAKADALIADPKGLAEARAVTARHAYATTAMMTLLNTARLHAGVLAPAQFAWLKLVDRSLWYALHSLGYETEGFGRYLHPNPRVEALGPGTTGPSNSWQVPLSSLPAWSGRSKRCAEGNRVPPRAVESVR